MRSRNKLHSARESTAKPNLRRVMTIDMSPS
jgi:hypothetical protein